MWHFITNFCVKGGHIGSHFLKRFDEDVPGIEPMLHRENSVIIHCHLGGAGGRIHTHTGAHTHTHKYTHEHTHMTQKYPELSPYGPLQAMNG